MIHKQALKDWGLVLASNSDLDIASFLIGTIIPLSVVTHIAGGKEAQPITVSILEIEDFVGSKSVVRAGIDILVSKGFVEEDIKNNRLIVGYGFLFSKSNYLFLKSSDEEPTQIGGVPELNSKAKKKGKPTDDPELAETFDILNNLFNSYEKVMVMAHKERASEQLVSKLKSIINTVYRTEVITPFQLAIYFELISAMYYEDTDPKFRSSVSMQELGMCKKLISSATTKLLLKIVPFFMVNFTNLAKIKKLRNNQPTLEELNFRFSLIKTEYLSIQKNSQSNGTGQDSFV